MWQETNLTWHEILRDMKSYVTWNLTWHEILRDMTYINVTWHESLCDVLWLMNLKNRSLKIYLLIKIPPRNFVQNIRAHVSLPFKNHWKSIFSSRSPPEISCKISGRKLCYPFKIDLFIKIAPHIFHLKYQGARDSNLWKSICFHQYRPPEISYKKMS